MSDLEAKNPPTGKVSIANEKMSNVAIGEAIAKTFADSAKKYIFPSKRVKL